MNPLSSPDPWSLVAKGYQDETVPAFRQYCRKALELTGYRGGSRVLDVACGPGTLALMIAKDAAHVDAIDFSEGMLDIFRAEAAKTGAQNINIQKMDGQKLTFGDAQFDFAFSMFGLMFFPDRMAGFRELYRTLKPGGYTAVSSWAPVSESPLMRMMFGGMRVAFPERPEPKANMLSLENPDLLKEEMQKAGFTSVNVTAFDGEWEVRDADSFVESMVRGSAPIEMLRRNLDKETWKSKRTLIRDYVAQVLPRVPATLTSRAYIGVGMKPE